jgi:signal transduction histidine kinase
MSHELRTPLNSILGFSEILRRRLEGAPDAKLHKFADNIHRAGQHLLSLISEILDLSRIESGRMELSPEMVPLTKTIDGVCEIARGVAKERGVTVEVDCPDDIGFVQVDPVRFKQILFNLLSNAIKFSAEGSPVEVVVRALAGHVSPLGVEAVRVSVVDHGIGINDEDREAIFDEFRQLEAWNERRHPGAGLGLTLVKRFVDLHHGIVELESCPDEGSTFSVVLPRRLRAPKPEAQESATSKAG